MNHNERMVKIGNYDLSFAPKSFWEYSRGSYMDTLVNDSKSYDNVKGHAEVSFLGAGRGTFLSKFNTEYSKRIIEMWSKEGDRIIDPFSGRSSRALTSALMKRDYTGFDVIKDNLNEAQEQYDTLSKKYNMSDIHLIHSSSEHILNYCEQGKYDLLLTCSIDH